MHLLYSVKMGKDESIHSTTFNCSMFWCVKILNLLPANNLQFENLFLALEYVQQEKVRTDSNS